MAEEIKHNSDLKKLKVELENHLEWGISSGWHSSMFTELSEKIFGKCQIMLSTTTLKRFFGVVNYEGALSISTLDTLSQFIGYDNWRSFINSKPTSKRSFEANIPRKSLYVTAGFFIALITIVLISNMPSDNSKIVDSITFSSRTLTNSYPNSVVFDFDLNNIRADSIHIQQYWDATKTVVINKEQTQATGIYYFPGYFRAKLMIDGKAVKEHDLFLKSNGWLGTIEYEPVPTYFEPISNKETILSYPIDLTQEIEYSKEPLTSVFQYVDDLGNISGDNFSLTASIRTAFNKSWGICQYSRVYILGTSGAMIIPFSKMGCSSNNFLMLNDVSKSGKEDDLSAFSADLSSFTDVKIEVKEQMVTISINGSEVYKTRYAESMGNLVGLRFKFLGLGEVRSFSLLDQVNNKIELK